MAPPAGKRRVLPASCCYNLGALSKRFRRELPPPDVASLATYSRRPLPFIGTLFDDTFGCGSYAVRRRRFQWIRSTPVRNLAGLWRRTVAEGSATECASWVANVAHGLCTVRRLQICQHAQLTGSSALPSRPIMFPLVEQKRSGPPPDSWIAVIASYSIRSTAW